MKLAGLIAVLIMLVPLNSFAQNEPPVGIEIDSKSERIDLITGKQIPDYKQAVRGSVQMFLERLDTPEDAVRYIRGGIMVPKLNDLRSLTKYQPRLDFWYINFKSGAIHSGPVIQKAISFVPLSLTKNEPAERVYLLLNDMQAIIWDTENQ